MSETFRRIIPEQAQQLRANRAQVVDIHDPQSYALAHISGSRYVDDCSVSDFIAQADLDQPLVVCYRGNSSQRVAAYFAC